MFCTVKNNIDYWCLIGIILHIILVSYWLTVESYEPFGDEIHFLRKMNLGVQVLSRSDNLISLLRNIYFFDHETPQYPPLFFLLSYPFTLIPPNEIFGVRVFIGLISIGTVLLTFRILKHISDSFFAFIGVIFLFTSKYWIQMSHFYLIDGVILFELVLFIYIYIKYIDLKNIKYLYLSAIVIAMGGLTKFSYPIYIIPLLIISLFFQIHSEKGTSFKNQIKAIVKWGVSITLPFILVSSYWYFVAVVNAKKSVVDQYSVLVKAGILVRPDNIATVISNLYKHNIWLFPEYLYLIIIVFTVIFVLNRFVFIKTDNSLCAAKSVLFIVLASIGFLFFTPTCLEILGRGKIDRWNFNYLFLIILSIFTIHRVLRNKDKQLCNRGFKVNKDCFDKAELDPYTQSNNKVINSSIHSTIKTKFILILMLCPLVFCIIDNYFREIRYRGILQNASYLFTKVPHCIHPADSRNKGINKIVSIIFEHSNYRRNLKKGASIICYSNFHIHEGFHCSAFQYYLKKLDNDTHWHCWHSPFVAMPVLLKYFTQSDYLIFSDRYKSTRLNYTEFETHLPSSYNRLLENVGQIHSERYGIFKIYFLDRNKLTPKIYLDLINSGLKLSQGTEFNIVWRMEKLLADVSMDARQAALKRFFSEYPLYKKKMSPRTFRILENGAKRLKAEFDFINSSKPIFILSKENQKLLNLSHNIDDVNYLEDGSIQFKAIGVDPQIILPVNLVFKPNTKYVLKVSTFVEADSIKNNTLEVFYSKLNTKGYPFSSKRRIASPYKSPSSVSYKRSSVPFLFQTFFILINKPDLGKHLRIDPGNKKGHYIIKEIEIREIG